MVGLVAASQSTPRTTSWLSSGNTRHYTPKATAFPLSVHATKGIRLTKSPDFRLPTSLSCYHPRLLEVGTSAPTPVQQSNVLAHCLRRQLHRMTMYFLNYHITHPTWVQGVASKQLPAAPHQFKCCPSCTVDLHTSATLSILQRKRWQIDCRGTHLAA